MDKVKVWNEFLEELRLKTSDLTFNTWFKDLSLINITDDKIMIAVQYQGQKTHIVNNYLEMISEIFLEITGQMKQIVFYLEDEYKPEENFNVIEETINNKDTTDFVNNRKTNLKSKYTFENFVVGDANRYAYSCCKAVAQNPGKLYNPLFIYGKSGLGKTHLMHAIGNYIVANSNLKVLYVTTDEFMNEFINISKNKGNKEENLTYIDLFKSKYRDIDVLMIDDIQFLGSATVTQQEFTNTFNALRDNDKQIVICSDRSVDDLKMFEERLKTRFNWGLKTIINIPDFDLKVKIIKNKIKSEELMLDLSDDIIDFIAANCGSDIRNLEGTLIRLLAFKAIWGNQTLTLENAREAVIDYTDNMIYTDNSIAKILQVVSKYFNLTVEDLKGKKRSKNIANARMIAMYLCRILTEESYISIAAELGGRDHSTIIHGFEKISEEIKTDEELKNIISELKVKMSE